MKELVQYGLACQEDLETVLRLQEQFEKESSLMCSQNKPTEEKIT